MGWVVNVTSRPFYPLERPGTHCTGGWVGPRAGLVGCRKSRSPPEFDPRPVEPVAGHYTDCAYPAPYLQARNRNGTRGLGGHRLALTILFLLISVHLHVRSCVSCADYARLAVVKYECGAMVECCCEGKNRGSLRIASPSATLSQNPTQVAWFRTRAHPVGNVK